MLGAFSRAVAQLGDARIRGILLRCLLLSIVAFAALWAGTGYLLTHTSLFEIGCLDTAVDVLGGLATLVLTWVLFPAVLSAFLGMFLEGVAGAVEAKHYPDLGEAKGLGFGATLAVTVRFLLVLAVFNLLLLFLLVFPPVFPFAFYAVNGYLLGREYFELVALRRLEPGAARALRKRHGAELFVVGVTTAFLLTVPLLNLLAPVIVTAAMVHLYEKWRRGDSTTQSGRPSATA